MSNHSTEQNETPQEDYTEDQASINYSAFSLKALEFPKLQGELVRLAETEQARESLQELSPSTDIHWIRNELKCVDEAKNIIERGISISFSGLSDIRPSLNRSKVVGSSLATEDFLEIIYHLRTHHNIRKILDRERGQLPLIYKRTRSLVPITELEQAVERTISPEGRVRDNASKELAKIRQQLAVVQVDIRRKLDSLISSLGSKGYIQGETYTIRDGRYVLPLKSENFRKIKGIVHDRSATGGTTFVEPAAVVDLGNEYRSLELAERDEVLRILRELTDKVREHRDDIHTNLEMVSLLDTIWAKAKLAEKLDAYEPKINTEGHIRIVQGRHPLLVLADERTVVPLTLELGKKHTCLVISGPNAGGKSVAMKCVGLCCAMAACGMHVPVLPGTELPIFEDYFVVIGDQQSLADDLSTFTAHATRIKEIILYANRDCLVLVDEIGAGTDPQEGASLSIAVLEKLAKRRILTIVTTHHGELKAFAHENSNCENGSMAFDTGTFEPTYQFHPNLPGSSYALDIARRVGFPKYVISRARAILGEERTQLEDLIADLSNKVRKYETLVAGQEKISTDFNELEDIYQKKLARLKDREKQIKRKAKDGVQEVINEARKQIEHLVKEIKEKEASKESIKSAHAGLRALSQKYKDPHVNAPAPKLPQESNGQPKRKRRKVARIKQAINKNNSLDHPFKKPEVGDWVEIDDSKTKGEIMEMSANGDRACVVLGSIQLWINVDRLTVTRSEGQQNKKQTYTAPRKQVPLELDLRGLEVEPALEKVDRYIYDGLSSGRNELSIIHGKGKGILSQAVRDYLKKQKIVDSFRFGEQGEGDYGVTIVKLKKK